MAFDTCSAGQCIDAAVTAAIFGSMAGLWALGYGIGKIVAWTRHIRAAA